MTRNSIIAYRSVPRAKPESANQSSAGRSRLRSPTLLLLLAAAVSSSGLLASTEASITLNQPLRQGALVTGTTNAPSVAIDGRVVSVGPQGQFVFGLGRDQQEVEICSLSGSSRRCTTHAVESGQWRIERVDGLPPKTVNPDPESAARIAREAKLVVRARELNSALIHFTGPWTTPTQGRISGVYGSQRILNGTPGSTHLGLDLAAPTGTGVVAAADGIVSLVHSDMLLSGKTLLIDHGHGVSTVYIHLSEITVTQGQSVQRGQRVGSVGSTGRASGPHLHWGLNWFDIKLDPQSLAAAD